MKNIYIYIYYIYIRPPQLRLICAQGRDCTIYIYIYTVYIITGTGMCVHIPIRLNPIAAIASLAWLGKQLPCPLQWTEVLHLFRWYPHTHKVAAFYSLKVEHRTQKIWFFLTEVHPLNRCCGPQFHVPGKTSMFKWQIANLTHDLSTSYSFTAKGCLNYGTINYYLI